MKLIENHNLASWAGSSLAKSRFPHWVRALISAVIQPDKLRMPSGDAVWLPGYDGYVVNSQQNLFVPVGNSAWELSTETGVWDKASTDYDKRSFDKVGTSEAHKVLAAAERAQATFVFVTPFAWKGRDAWLKEKNDDKIWRAVVVIDGEDLKRWIEAADAVSLQFAAEIGIAPENGLQTPDQAWEEWSHRTIKPASESLIVAGRAQQEREFISRLADGPSTFTVRGHSPSEAWAFALAAIRRVESESDRQSLYSRTIVVANEDVAHRLTNFQNLIIILKEARGQVSGNLSSRGSHVVVPDGNDNHSVGRVIDLSRPTHRQFTESLAQMGLKEEEAEKMSRACGLSVTILQRQWAHATYSRPTWADDSSISHLLPAMLAGRWHDRSTVDREILQMLAGVSSYDDVQNQLHRFLLVDDPPLQRLDDMWTLVAPVDVFQLAARHLIPSHLSRFEVAFRRVFGTIDPKVELSPDEWIYQDAKDNARHSEWLRSGLAETLLLIAERGKDAGLRCDGSPQDYATRTVRGLPGLNDDWRLLASIRDQYSRLMEAAPDPLLDSLERLLEANPADVKKIFAEGSSPLSGGGMHTGVLWGLELLAWEPKYLPRVALVLAKMATIDPGGRLSNRPLNSLRDIFLWWLPGTNASAKDRLAALDGILALHPSTGWDLLERLLPRENDSLFGTTAKPRWRDFGDLPPESRSRREIGLYASAIVNRALDRLGHRPERWKAILDALHLFGADEQRRTLSLIAEIPKDTISAETRSEMWSVLREYIAENRRFPDAHWVLAVPMLNRLETVLDQFKPADVIERVRWLFDEWMPDLPSQEDDDIDKQQAKIAAKRREAIVEVLSKQGREGVVQLGVECKLPGYVAHTILPVLSEVNEVRDLVDLAITKGEKGIFLAAQISGEASRVFGEEWRSAISRDSRDESWSPSVAASLLLLWPDEPSTWSRVEALGAEAASYYWRHKNLVIFNKPPEQQAYEIERLIEVGRALMALDSVALDSKKTPSKVLLRLFDAAMDELAASETADEIRRTGLTSHDISKVLADLRSRQDVTPEEVAKREYLALPLLSYRDDRGLTLHTFMASNPEFFMEVLCAVFLPSGRDKTKDQEPTEESRSRASAAFKLLEGLNTVPGTQENGDISESALIGWIEEVRKLANVQDRAAIADQRIGHILARAPMEADDGAWPHKAVRSAIEKFNHKNIRTGVMIERHNMRGVYSKSLYEGGTQERDLATKYREWSRVSKSTWPCTARLLDDIADDWDKQAQAEDMRAKQEMLED